MIDYENYGDEEAGVIVPVTLPGIRSKVNVLMKRIDLVHPVISGNKWYKMKYNIVEMQNLGLNTMLTFGGAYSNHIHAAAHAGKIFGFKTIGLIRGEKHIPLNVTLQAAVDEGMELHYVDRTTFRKRETREFLTRIKETFGNVYILPVGGSNKLALKGCAEIIEQIDIDFDYICSASGSGGTFAGLVVGLKGNKYAIAFPALKGAGFLEEVITDLIFDYTGNKYSNWHLNTDYHFGGFAKHSRELIEFTHEFNKINTFELDYIYTNKMMFGIADLIKNGFLKSGETIIAIHSGGLQGNEGMKEKVRKIMIRN
jgi:1-aminocyclopropane-1-carboxylate deaminase/D-cysteine desulfhydrase-like pyridoxal-dependent ACC family enzyme